MSSIDKINVGGVDFDIASSPTPVMAPVETGTTATQPYAVGDYVIVGSTLHEVTSAIAIGDTFTEGTNISTSTSLGDEIKQINNKLTTLERSGVMPNLDYAKAVIISTNTAYTVPSDGIIFVSDANGGGAITIKINNKTINTVNYGSGIFSFNQQYPVHSGDIFLSNRNNSTFVPLRN